MTEVNLCGRKSGSAAPEPKASYRRQQRERRGWIARVSCFSFQPFRLPLFSLQLSVLRFLRFPLWTVVSVAASASEWFWNRPPARTATCRRGPRQSRRVPGSGESPYKYRRGQQVFKSRSRQLSCQRLRRQPAMKRPADQRARPAFEHCKIQCSAPPPWPQFLQPCLQRCVVLFEAFPSERRAGHRIASRGLLPGRQDLMADPVPEIRRAGIRPILAPANTAFAQSPSSPPAS